MITIQTSKVKTFLIKNLHRHPKNIVSYTAKVLQVTRTTVHRHLNYLLKQGEIIKTGSKKGCSYFLKKDKNKTLTFPIIPELDEFQVWKEYFLNDFKQLKSNIFSIFEYGFTEILNNAIDHARGKKVIVTALWQKNKVTLIVQDDGIGIFKKLQLTFHLNEIKESILEMTKGKITTDPAHHTGEGLFFTSRAFDELKLRANGLLFVRDNVVEDWFVKATDDSVGTEVSMSLALNSVRDLTNLFKQYQTDKTLAFSKTEIMLKLIDVSGEHLISRSQAKRLLRGLEQFKTILLDFKDVEAVGQGFVDEVFRVFLNQHSDIEVKYHNANPEIIFMIERSL